MIDYHIHTTFSDGERSAREIIDLAREQGLQRIAITDHFDPSDLHQSNAGVTVDQLAEHFADIRSYSSGQDIIVYCGIETCMSDDGLLTLPEGCRELCDIIITSPHFLDRALPCVKGEYMNDAYWQAYKVKLLHMAAGEGDVLGHPEGYLPLKPMLDDGTTYLSRQQICRDISERYFDELFVDRLGDALVRSGKAYELHGATSTPREWVVEALHRKGVTFSVGSDAHAVNILGGNSRAMQLVKKYGLRLIQLHSKQ
ncbi:MAG: PHP domain-containing protein [Angelakisella sp.]